METALTRPHCDETGAMALWLISAVLAGTALLGLVYDGGRIIDARLDADRVAVQAARAGADQLSEASIRSGDNEVAAQAAIAAARDYLHATGRTGRVEVAGDRVTVTVRDTVTPKILNAFGFGPVNIREAESARGIQGGN